MNVSTKETSTGKDSLTEGRTRDWEISCRREVISPWGNDLFDFLIRGFFGLFSYKAKLTKKPVLHIRPPRPD